MSALIDFSFQEQKQTCFTFSLNRNRISSQRRAVSPVCVEQHPTPNPEHHVINFFPPPTQVMFVLLPSIVLLSTLLSLPIFLHSYLHIPGGNSNSNKAATAKNETLVATASGGDFERSDEEEDEEEGEEVSHIVFCIEDWNFEGRHERGI